MDVLPGRITRFYRPPPPPVLGIATSGLLALPEAAELLVRLSAPSPLWASVPTDPGPLFSLPPGLTTGTSEVPGAVIRAGPGGTISAGPVAVWAKAGIESGSVTAARRSVVARRLVMISFAEGRERIAPWTVNRDESEVVSTLAGQR